MVKCVFVTTLSTIPDFVIVACMISLTLGLTSFVNEDVLALLSETYLEASVYCRRNAGIHSYVVSVVAMRRVDEKLNWINPRFQSLCDWFLPI